MTIVAFMQNQWVRDPARVKASIAAYGEKWRRRFIKYALFAGCKSGRVLDQVFGELCEQIEWEETTREIADNPRTIFPPDIDHMIDVIRTHKPDVILTFGTIAWNALAALQEKSDCAKDCVILKALHPAARHPGTIAALRETKRQLVETIARLSETKTHECARP